MSCKAAASFTFFESVATLLRRVNAHFGQINRSGGLTDEDKKRLKELYLEQLVVPRARALMRKYYPEGSAAQPQNTPQQNQRTS